jgi:hypothetical protein
MGHKTTSDDSNVKQAYYTLRVRHSHGPIYESIIPLVPCGDGSIIAATARVVQMVRIPPDTLLDEDAMKKSINVWLEGCGGRLPTKTSKRQGLFHHAGSH